MRAARRGALSGAAGVPEATGKAGWDCRKSLWGDPPASWRDLKANWTYVGVAARAALVSAPGWIMTALAISLGAPFWFDILNKFMIVRTTVKPHEKSGEEASKDPVGRDDARDGSAPGDPGKGGSASKPPPWRPPPPSPGATAPEQAEIAALDPEERPREDAPPTSSDP